MPIDDKLELHLIDTKDLIEEAKRIREAKKLVKDSQKVKKELAAGVSPLGGPALPQQGAPISNRPKQFFESEQQTRKGAIGGARTDTAFKQQQQKQKDLEKQLQDQKKKQDELEKNQAKLEKDVEKAKKELETKRQDFEDKLTGFANIAKSSILQPTSVLALAITKIKGYGIIGAIVGSILAQVLGPLQDEFQKQFDRGGIFDTKIKVPKQALTVNNLDVQNSWKDGTKYITSDLRIVQKAPQSSNTLKISHEAIRYVLDDLGRGP